MLFILFSFLINFHPHFLMCFRIFELNYLRNNEMIQNCVDPISGEQYFKPNLNQFRFAFPVSLKIKNH